MKSTDSLATPESRSIEALSAEWHSIPREQIEEVFNLANSVFENSQTAEEWLADRNLATDNKPPIALLGTESGLLRVTTLLHRIEYGILA